jgi:hypothetical protein
MSNIITAGNATNNGTSISSDTSGVLELKTGSTPTTALTIGTNQVVTFAQQPAGTFAGTGPAFSATPSTTQAVTSSVYTKVNLGTENFDTNNNFASSRFTPTVAGYYSFSGSIYSVAASGATYIWALIYKNGGLAVSGNLNVPVSGIDGIGTVNGLVFMNGSTDYVEMYCYLAGTSPVIQTGAVTVFSGVLVRGA